jgi:hypothetical protein
MVRFPTTVIITGVEAVRKVLQEVQQLFDPETGNKHSEHPPSHPVGTGCSAQNIQKEDYSMTGQDLGGDDLKVVRYRIIFTKRDNEATLFEGEETVNYPTDGGSYGGLKVADFFQKVLEHKIHRPQKWVDANYPPNAPSNTDWQIPNDDKRYVTFLYEVLGRVEREEAEYDKEKVRLLGEIRDRL